MRPMTGTTIRSPSIIRHYDVTGKLCPLYYVENEDAWDKLKDDVADYIEKNGSYVDPEDVREE